MKPMIWRVLEKRNLIKSGYCAGGSVPKTELEGGRSQDNWLVYCHKWFALEELKEDKYTKGILDRSFKLHMIPGDVQYNIKDLLTPAGDPVYQQLREELDDLRKSLFCFRLKHHDDQRLQVKLNVTGRTAELTNPLIRLFQDSPIALEKILDSLSMFIQERNETTRNSFESKLYEAVEKLVNERIARIKDGNPTDEDLVLVRYEFTNHSIKEKLIEITEAQPIPDKDNMYYSAEIGPFSQTKISSILKSKFKAKKTKPSIKRKTTRCVEFKKEYLDRIKSIQKVRTVRTVRTPI